MTVKRAILYFLLIASLLRPAVGISAAEPAMNSQPSSLCRAEEQIFFSCAVAGSAKLVSLCGSKSLDHRRGYLQYRHGKPGAIELQFPQARANKQQAFRYAHYFRAQVDRTEISFDNHDYRNTLFDYFAGDVKPPIASAGVRVGKHGSKGPETELLCHGKPRSNLGALEAVIPRDHDNALNR